jgi:hypothetical protein
MMLLSSLWVGCQETAPQVGVEGPSSLDVLYQSDRVQISTSDSRYMSIWWKVREMDIE